MKIFHPMRGDLFDDDPAIDARIKALEDELDALQIGRVEIPRTLGNSLAVDHADLMHRLMSRTPDPGCSILHENLSLSTPLRARANKLRQDLAEVGGEPVLPRYDNMRLNESTALNKQPPPLSNDVQVLQKQLVDSRKEVASWESEVASSRARIKELDEYLVQLAKSHESELHGFLMGAKKMKTRIQELEIENDKLRQAGSSVEKRIGDLQVSQSMAGDDNRKLHGLIEDLRRENEALREEAEQAKARNEDIVVVRSTIADFENQRMADSKLIAELRTEYRELSERTRREIDQLKLAYMADECSHAPPHASVETLTLRPGRIQFAASPWLGREREFGSTGRRRSHSPSESRLPPYSLHDSVEVGGASVSTESIVDRRHLSRRPLSPSPPWALHEETPAMPTSPSTPNPKPDGGRVAQFGQVNSHQTRQAAPTASPPFIPVDASTELESRLMKCNLEKGELEGWLSRIPFNSAGRTLKERREKYLKERRLGELDRQVSELRLQLKERRRERHDPMG